MNKYWVGVLSLDGESPKTALYDSTHQDEESSLVTLYISELNREVVYEKDLVRPKLRKLHLDGLTALTAIARYEKVRQPSIEDICSKSFFDTEEPDYYSDDSKQELLRELYDDACDYARSEEEGWFYTDSDDEIGSVSD